LQTDPELAEAERRFANLDQTALLPEEREVLSATEAALRQADTRESAFREAAQCIKAAGA